MVTGLDKFREAFIEYADNYVFTTDYYSIFYR